MESKEGLAVICPYVHYCWRHSYSRYLTDHPYTVPPDRLTLVLAGYATPEMTENRAGKRIYAQYMPCLQDGEVCNLCPLLAGCLLDDCFEYRKESRRLEALANGRRRREATGNARVWIPKETRRAVFQRDRYKCQLCGVAVNTVKDGERVKFVIDHVIPLSRGGHPTALDNLQVLCYNCNQSKLDKLPGE